MKKNTRVHLISDFVFIVAVFAAWQIIAHSGIFLDMAFPTVPEIARAFVDGLSGEGMLSAAAYSLSLVLRGLVFSIIITFILASLAILFEPVRAVFNLLVAVFDPLPGIAIMPIAILLFGIDEKVILFLMLHGVVWPMSRGIMDGYNSVPKIYTEVGENIGLKGIGLVLGIYMPAAFPYILNGLKIGWARAWRALISAEMIFGIAGDIKGIGAFIFERRYKLDSPGMFACLIIIILIGILVEYGIFAQIEKRTIKKWGMVRS
jgi:NitT/TauT family transport system permease protein